MITLEQAISECRGIAEMQTENPLVVERFVQIADWLEELKELKDDSERSNKKSRRSIFSRN